MQYAAVVDSELYVPAAHVVAAALDGSAKDRRRVNLVSFKSHILKRFFLGEKSGA